MPFKNIDYSKTIIYKICCNDLNVKEIYVGSTCNFIKRKSKHKDSCNNIKSKQYNYKLYQFIRDNQGWENFSMIEIEKYSCNDNNEARSRERYWYENLNATLNIIKPIRTIEEKTEYDKEYRQTEKYKEYEQSEQRKEYQKEYQKTEKCKEYKKSYYDEHKEYYKEYRKDYEQSEKRKNYKQQIKEKVTCLCGAIISINSKSRHDRTFKHISKTQSLFTE